jgi:ABC-type branched-subunit amino acid transport system permease subunit
MIRAGSFVSLAAGAVLLVGVPLLVRDQYQLHVASLIGCYWILIAGLNLVVGFAGQLSIGHVGLLAAGAYAFAIVSGKWGLDPQATLLVSGGVGGICGLLLGIPSLRLPGFYFAMATLAFSLIVSELSLAQGDLTGGGIGLPVPTFLPPFDAPAGFYWLVLSMGALVTWLTWNVARFMWGRALIAIRDSEVAAASVSIPIYRLKLAVFAFSGVTAGIAGALFASLQSYITPETFTFDTGLFFFVCIVIGGRGSILGPFVGTVVLTALPEVVAPLAKLGNFFYGLLLLAVVLLAPEGIGRLFGWVAEWLRPPSAGSHVVDPDLPRLAAAIRSDTTA